MTVPVSVIEESESGREEYREAVSALRISGGQNIKTVVPLVELWAGSGTSPYIAPGIVEVEFEDLEGYSARYNGHHYAFPDYWMGWAGLAWEPAEPGQKVKEYLEYQEDAEQWKLVQPLSDDPGFYMEQQGVETTWWFGSRLFVDPTGTYTASNPYPGTARVKIAGTKW